MLWQVYLVYSFLTSHSRESQVTWETSNIASLLLWREKLTIPTFPNFVFPSPIGLNRQAVVKQSVLTMHLLPRGGQSSAPGQCFPSFLRSLRQYQPWLLGIVPPATTVGYYTLSAMVQSSQQWFPRLCVVFQKTMLLNHFHDLQAELIHAILYLVQIICSYSPLHHMSSALRMSAIRKHINIFYQQITSNTVSPNLSSAYIKLLGEIEIQKWNFLTNWGQQL